MSIVPDRRKTDLQLLCEAAAAGRKPDRELVERVRKRSASLRRKLSEELSVALVRAARDE